MQLTLAKARCVAGVLAGVCVVVAGAGKAALADDRADITTTYYVEQRKGDQGGLQVIHPQVDLGVDVGETVILGAGYSADVVSGATASVYSADAVSTATTFSDTRHEGRFSLGFAGRRSTLTFAAGTATERDYLSISVGAGAAVELPGKNTTLSLSYNHSFDDICDRENADAGVLERIPLTGQDECRKKYALLGEDAVDVTNPMSPMTVWRDLSIDTVQASVTQNLSPTAVMQLGLFGQVLSGYQANPYRRVQLGDARVGSAVFLPQELVPDVRGRAAVTARVNFFVRPVRGAVHLMGRGYSDTWGVRSFTGELAYSQYAGQSLLLRLRARAYQQTAAKFFKDAYFYQTEYPAGTYFTGDRELGQVRNVMVGAKLSFISVGKDGKQVLGVFDKIQLNLKGDLLLLDELPSGNVADNRDGIEGQFLSAGQVLDAVILQLGLLMTY